MVRAKFRCTKKEVTAEKGEEIVDVQLEPVYSESGENKKYWDTTPSGSIRLLTLNREAANEFDIDSEYYVDFTKA